MNGLDILKTITKDGISCKYFGGLMAINKLHFRRKQRIFYICNTDRWENKGKHWIVMYYLNGVFEFFDPLGKPPDSLFSNFMQKYSSRFIFNKVKVQKVNSNTCGEYCIFFASMRSRNVKFKDIIKYMHQDTHVLGFVNDLASCN